MCQKICYGSNVFLGYLKRGNACSLNIFGHEQYPYNSVDQNNSPHGVYSVTHEGKYYIPYRFLVWLCNTPPSFKKYVMEPNVFLKYLVRGIACVLNSFRHEQYLYKSDIYLWCLSIEYLNEGIGFLVGFGRAMQYPSMCQKICYGAQCTFGIPRKG